MNATTMSCAVIACLLLGPSFTAAASEAPQATRAQSRMPAAPPVRQRASEPAATATDATAAREAGRQPAPALRRAQEMQPTAERVRSLEGEIIRARASRGSVWIQDMSAHGDGWSGGKQLYWEAPGEGAMLTLAPDVPAGDYEVVLFLTQGPAYARLEAMGPQGVIPNSAVELYGPTLAPPAQVSLGVLRLGPELGFAISIIGKDPRATAYGVGVDRIEARARPQAAARE